jgi:hypothetical protein
MLPASVAARLAEGNGHGNGNGHGHGAEPTTPSLTAGHGSVGDHAGHGHG